MVVKFLPCFLFLSECPWAGSALALSPVSLPLPQQLHSHSQALFALAPKAWGAVGQ